MAGTAKGAARKRTDPVIYDVAAEEFVPLRLSSADEIPEPERVTIAYLDDYALTMPKTMPPNLALRVLSSQRKQGAELAMMDLLEGVLGEEGFQHLSNWKRLTIDNLVDIFKVVQKVAMGALEIPK